MEPVLQFFSRTFDLTLGRFTIPFAYWQALILVFLVFVLVLTVARIRFLYVNWSLGKSSLAMLFWGFLLALILEGLLILSGRTLLTETLGWENAPKPISTALDAGRSKLVDVLGVTAEVPTSTASESPTSQSVLRDYRNLSSEEAAQVTKLICSPR